ncbi:transcriptional regulator, IclR family [Pseudonocardia sp. N23]|nr:IclR family transcriptional regulator [Pseudonocardia sp. N23]GAY09499.1 transcriptional regulator, IclR family [Pseudonocardia sp. N23]
MGYEMAGQAEPGAERSSGRVQSVERTFELLEAMSDLGGTAGLSQLAARLGLPLPTIHRLVRTLVDLGYVRQQPSREYALGPRLMRLGEHASRLLGTWAMPHLRDLVDEIGESANLAMLDGDHVVYTAQVPGVHSMRMFTEVGRRAQVHCTAVGKAMLALMPREQADVIVRGSVMTPQTGHTIVTLDGFHTELARVKEMGYAVDNEEQEIGVRCVAVAVPGRTPRAAFSISGPSPRMTDALIHRAVPLLRRAAEGVAGELDESGPGTAKVG